MKGKLFTLIGAALLLEGNSQAPVQSPPSSSPPAQFKQGEPMPPGAGSFNFPAVCDIRKSERVSGFADGSFIYWCLREEGLAVATNAVLNSGATFLSSPVSKFSVADDYKPGFKVCAGVVIDHKWEVSAEYTWIRGTSTRTGPAPSFPTQIYGASTPSTGTPVWSMNDWFVQKTGHNQAITASQLSATWKLGVDIVDCMAGRPFYQGRYLTISPGIDLRAMWIRQYFEVSATQAAGSFVTGFFPPGSMPPQPIRSINYSHCWSIGPRVGADYNFLLPWRFRIEGKLAGSLLYTDYTTTHEESAASTNFAGSVNGSDLKFQHLRPVAEAGLGLGWGRYWGSDESYHTDFLASFDYTLLWEQNMMRSILDDLNGKISPSSGTLVFYGLTLTSRLDF